jgi:hypothetical protein
MKRLIYLLLIMVIPVVLTAQDANDILRKTIQAYGGAAWDTVNYIRMHYVGHQQWLEQSENPTGPFITSYFDTEEIRGAKELKLYQKTEGKANVSSGAGVSTSVQVDTAGYTPYGKRKMPLYYGFAEENLKWMQYGPEYLLRQAQRSGVKLDKMIELEGVNHYLLSYTDSGIGYKIFINASTGLISEAHVDTYTPYGFFFSLWGKFTTRIQYSLYSLNKHNLIYPLQWDVYRTGHLWKKISISDIEFLKAVNDTLFVIPGDIQKARVGKEYANSAKLAVNKVIEVAKGIYVIPGYWFTGWVEQEDGIVILEAPMSTGYSVQLMNEVKKRYPSKKIKGVIVTSDAWPHLAGIREYISENIPVYTNKLNKATLDRIVAADFSPQPDHQQIKKAKPEYKLIDKTLLLNDKNTPLQIIPVNGEGGERMVFVYFPNQKVLYASDLVQRGRAGDFFFIEYLSEVKAVVDRYKLNVEKVYAMHLAPVAWKEIETALDKNK